VGGACTQFTRADDLSSCDGDSEIFQLARALPPRTVDAIVAGHTHAAIAHRVAGIPIIESYANGRAFGRIDLTVDLAPPRGRGRGRRPPKGRPAVVDARLFPPQDLARPGFAFFGTYEGAPLAVDPDVVSAIAPALAAARAKRDAKLGVTITRPIVPATATESALGNLFADLMRAARPKADVALTSGGSLRAALPAGPLTYGQLYEALPFDDRFATIPITGGDLAATIARNLGRAGGVVSLSGLRAQAACVDGALQVRLLRPGGAPVGAAERLTLVTSEFIATGGAGILSDEVRAPAGPADGPTIRDAMADLLRARRGPLDPDNPPLYDAAHPRLGYAGRRPLACR
jgi:5'-nucleotidase